MLPAALTGTPPRYLPAAAAPRPSPFGDPFIPALSGILTSGPNGSVAVLPSAGSVYAGDDAQFINTAWQYTDVVVLIPGMTYQIATPVVVPGGCRLDGQAGAKHVPGGAVLKCGASFAGAYAVMFAGGTQEQQVANVTLDGSAMPAGTCVGIGSPGSVNYAQLSSLLVSGAGFTNGIRPTPSAGGGQASGWRLDKVVVTGCTATGFLLANCPDFNVTTCQAIAAGDKGWSFNDCDNSRFTACQADFSGTSGFFVQGAWTTGFGMGGMQMVNCSTDRNNQHGLLITATGDSPVNITGMTSRRDGSTSTSAGWAGIAVSSAGVPVVVTGWVCTPGVNDDGTGSLTPQYGLNLLGTNLLAAVSGALLHAVTAGINGTSGASYRNVWTRTGTPGSATAPALTPDTA